MAGSRHLTRDAVRLRPRGRWIARGVGVICYHTYDRLVESKQEERMDLRQDDLSTQRRTFDRGVSSGSLEGSPDLECEAHS
jgi:hypothetical protein